MYISSVQPFLRFIGPKDGKPEIASRDKKPSCELRGGRDCRQQLHRESNAPSTCAL